MQRRELVLKTYIDWLNARADDEAKYQRENGHPDSQAYHATERDYYGVTWITTGDIIIMQELDDGGYFHVIAYMTDNHIERMVQFFDGEMTVII